MRRTFFVMLLGMMIAGGSWPTIAHQEPTMIAQPAQTSDLVTANNQFAFDLYAALGEGEDNLIFSPYSISMALAMVYAGADGNTAAQMAETLHFDMPREDLNTAFFELQNAFNADVESYEDVTPSELNIVNGLWGQSGYPFRPEYLDVLQTRYEAGFETVDFAHEPDTARELINGWISDNTNGRIEEMLDRSAITPQTRTILANIIFFHGTWLELFSKDDTTDGTFILLDGGEVSVPMMHRFAALYYYAGENYQVVELEFQDSALIDRFFEMKMLFILPDDGAFEDVEAEMDLTWFNTTLDNLESTLMNLALPTFDYETSLDLADILIDMGMQDVFDPSLANFSGIVDESDEPFFIDFILHRANISVDEEGATAAAATVVGLGGCSTCGPNEPFDLIFDRPFIYAIFDRVSGSILFLGRVMNPES
ncbi:MAG: serpin family protein [Chloroflexi bacterium]|nr:serpin family protein [Chloroflexota bacterium]